MNPTQPLQRTAQQIKRDQDELEALIRLSEGIGTEMEVCNEKLLDTINKYDQLKGKLEGRLAKIQNDYPANFQAIKAPPKAAKKYSNLSINLKLTEKKVHRLYDNLNLEGMIKGVNYFESTLPSLEKIIEKTMKKNSDYKNFQEAEEVYKNIEVYSRYVNDCINAMNRIHNDILVPLVEKENLKNETMALVFSGMFM